MKPFTSPKVSLTCCDVLSVKYDRNLIKCKCYQCRDIESPIPSTSSFSTTLTSRSSSTSTSRSTSRPTSRSSSITNNKIDVSHKTRAEVFILPKKTLIFIHFLSLFSCLLLLIQTTLVSATNVNTISNNNDLNLKDIGGYQPKLEDPGGDEHEHETFIQKYSDQISIRVNPLLRHRRLPYYRHMDHQMCHVWTRNSPKDLCNKGRWARLRHLRELSIFSTDCKDEKTNIQLGELFRLDWTKIKSEDDLLSFTEHLKDGSEGRDCIIASPKTEQCLNCYNRIDKSFQIMDKAYDAFNKTLRRFDCMLAVDISSATRPFSPNGTCDDCKKWYRRWLLVQLIDIWNESPCINWCYYAQLACPHLAPSRQVDYAGHPSFLCRDRKISYSPIEEMSSCTCFHPCEIMHIKPEPDDWLERNKYKASVKYGYDFFASDEHCWARNHRCNKEKELLQGFVDGSRIPRTKNIETNSIISVDSSSFNNNNGNKLFGYIKEYPEELFNQLGSWFFSSSSSSSVDKQSILKIQHRHQHRKQRDNSSSNTFYSIILLLLIIMSFI